jgi:murein L,D-transpeptidase YafK
MHFPSRHPLLAIVALTALLGTIEPSLARSSNDIIAEAMMPAVHEEESLLLALENWKAGETDKAISSLESLLLRQPNFELARALHSDLQRAKAGEPTLLAHLPSKAPDSSLNGLLAEIKARWNHHVAGPAEDAIPSNLLRLSGDQPYAIVVDLEKSRLFLFENVSGRPKLVNSFYSGIGRKGAGKQVQGDLKTPVGVYFAVDYLEDAELPELYGAGAIPVSYPNILDIRRGRTGGGIWLHGVPRNTYARAPLSSRGCVTMANDDFEALRGHVDIARTPVVLAGSIDWIDSARFAEAQTEFTSIVDKWREDWESRDSERYLSNYHESFQGQGMNYGTWADYKARVNGQKKFIQIEIADLSIFQDPAEDVMVVRFFQRYRSNTFASDSRKRQYWRKNKDGVWLIIHEDHVPGTSMTAAEVPVSLGTAGL